MRQQDYLYKRTLAACTINELWKTECNDIYTMRSEAFLLCIFVAKSINKSWFLNRIKWPLLHWVRHWVRRKLKGECRHNIHLQQTPPCQAAGRKALLQARTMEWFPTCLRDIKMERGGRAEEERIRRNYWWPLARQIEGIWAACSDI